MDNVPAPAEQQALAALIDLTTESWRFGRLFARLVTKLDAGESSRFISQHRYYLKKLEEALALAGLHLVNIEGQQYEPGMAASPLNSGDFSIDDILVVEQMLEPIILGPAGVLKTGVVTLRKA